MPKHFHVLRQTGLVKVPHVGINESMELRSSPPVVDSLVYMFKVIPHINISYRGGIRYPNALPEGLAGLREATTLASKGLGDVGCRIHNILNSIEYSLCISLVKASVHILRPQQNKLALALNIALEYLQQHVIHEKISWGRWLVESRRPQAYLCR